MDFMGILIWLMGGGCIIASSWLLERFAWYQTLASKTREIVFFCVSVLFGIGAFLVSSYVPADVIQAITPYFVIVASTFSYVFLGKGFHIVDKG